MVRAIVEAEPGSASASRIRCRSGAASMAAWRGSLTRWTVAMGRTLAAWPPFDKKYCLFGPVGVLLARPLTRTRDDGPEALIPEGKVGGVDGTRRPSVARSSRAASLRC